MTCSKTMLMFALIALVGFAASPADAQSTAAGVAAVTGSGSGAASGSGTGSAAKPADPTAEMEVLGHKVRATVDLFGDGKQYEVVLKAAANHKPKEGEATEFHVVVIGPDKKVVWEDKKPEMTFQIGDAGVEDMQIVGDIDGDKAIEIVSPAMQSDVAPVTFRVMRWVKDHFEKAKGGLLIGNQPVPTEFNWTDKEPAPEAQAVWVLYFEKLQEPGVLQAYIAQTGEAKLPGDRAILRVTPTGYKVEKWMPGED